MRNVLAREMEMQLKRVTWGPGSGFGRSCGCGMVTETENLKKVQAALAGDF